MNNRISVTRGMSNATKTVAKQCPDCGLKVPSYPGRYPKNCPDCGASFEAVDEAVLERKSWADLKKAAGDLKKATTRKKARSKAKKVGKLAKTQKAAEKRGDAKTAQKAQAKRRKITQKAQQTHAKAKDREAEKKRKERRKLSRKESVNESFMPRALRNQAPSIREALTRDIRRSGAADLSEIARRLKANPIAVYNLVREHCDEWGVVMSGKGYTVYPRKDGSRIDG